jgi:hypothetical protein
VMPARGSVRGVRSSRTASISFLNTLFVVKGWQYFFLGGWNDGVGGVGEGGCFGGAWREG